MTLMEKLLTPENLDFMGVDRIITEEPYTFVAFEDGGVTYVKCAAEDTYDEEKGILLALAKGLLLPQENEEGGPEFLGIEIASGKIFTI